MLNFSKEQQLKTIANGLRLDVALLKYELTEEIVKGTQRRLLCEIQSKIIEKERQLKLVHIGKYNKEFILMNV